MKIKCVRHQRRVVVTSNGNMMHRTGDGSRCKGFQLTGTNRIIDETNGQRYFVTERVLACDIQDDWCKHCDIPREEYNYIVYRAEEGFPSLNDDYRYLSCPKRQGRQSHVWC